jgi:NitT/TauT family transport system ATP-binding protein
MFSIKNLTKTYQGKNQNVEAIKHIDLDIKPGEFVSIVGPSGCGKTTLLKLCAKLINPTTGTIKGAEAKDISLVFQQPVLLGWLTVKQNIMLPTKLEKQQQINYEKLLNIVQLKGYSQSYPQELSGGMKQRVAIARSLISNPKIILMDEPFAALDEQLREELNDQLLAIHKKIKPTIIFVTHSISEAVYLSDRVIVLSKRPTTIKKEFKIKLGKRTKELRDTKKFHEVVKCIRSEI